MENLKKTCPLELTQEILKKKWSAIILWRLRLGSMRIRDFKRDLKNSNSKMIISHINFLLEIGLICKVDFDTYPKHSEYSLTEKGEAILPILKSMQEYGIKYLI